MILDWDSYFMNIAIITSFRSKDLNTQVGSVIVSENHKILGTGYNGLPTGIDESQFPTSRDGEFHETKYAYTVHAEANCICNSSSITALKGSTIYTTLFPCCWCAKLLLQCGIKKVIFLNDKYHNDPMFIASRKLFDTMNVNCVKFTGNLLIPQQQ